MNLCYITFFNLVRGSKMAVGQILTSMPGNVKLRPTVSRGGALEVAVAHMVERGQRELSLQILDNPDEFTLIAGEFSVELRVANGSPKPRGSPPSSGWTKVNKLSGSTFDFPKGSYRTQNNTPAYFLVSIDTQGAVLNIELLVDITKAVSGQLGICDDNALALVGKPSLLPNAVALYLCASTNGEPLVAKFRRYV